MPKAHDELAHYWCGMLIFFLPLLLLLRLLLGLFFLLITLWAIWKCRSESMLEGKAVNASQAFNCKHMVRICKEAMAKQSFFKKL